MRESIGKHLRFEIFKRDKFTCQYCGRKPPEVTLQIDHILAVANGGGSDETNLLTSCADCNAGKGAWEMDRTLAPVNVDNSARQERIEQLKAYQALVLAEQELADDAAEEVFRRWALKSGFDMESDVWSFPVPLFSGIPQFLKLLPLGEVLDAVEITFKKFPRGHGRYFCGVCWKKIHDRKERNVHQTLQPDTGFVASGEPQAAPLLHGPAPVQ